MKQYGPFLVEDWSVANGHRSLRITVDGDGTFETEVWIHRGDDGKVTIRTVLSAVEGSPVGEVPPLF